jgi:predicted peptidase
MKRIFLYLIFVFFANIVLTAQNNELFEKREFIHRGDTLRYRVLFPENYDRTRNYPLVLFLHGAGERGNYNERQLIHGATLFENEENRRNYPAIVLFPQCPIDEFWAPVERIGNERIFPQRTKATKPMQLVERLVNHYQKNEAVDKRRMYIFGLSMGGMGTFDYICRHPRKFAAAIPICGGVNLNRLKKVRNMPIRIYHGSDDTAVSPEFSRDAFIELKAHGSQKVEYIEFPGVGHASWHNAFAEPDFLSWMFKQRR